MVVVVLLLLSGERRFLTPPSSSRLVLVFKQARIRRHPPRHCHGSLELGLVVALFPVGGVVLALGDDHAGGDVVVVIIIIIVTKNGILLLRGWLALPSRDTALGLGLLATALEKRVWHHRTASEGGSTGAG
jgi:hypothetical protein